jgi:hypothetical protein
MRYRFFAKIAVLTLWATAVVAVHAQAAAATRYMGSVTAINGDKLTVKTQQGDEHQVQVSSTAEVKRIEPGQTNLNTAVAMPFSEIANGDRVLVWVDPASTSGTPQALRVVAMKAADLAKKQQRDLAEWQQNGVGGLVKSVDAASGNIVVTSGAGPTAKVVTIHTDSKTSLKRYAPNSESYDAAKSAPFSTIQEGDQLMARGKKDPTTGDIAAAELVSGSFRNISGLIASIDPATQSFTIKDLASKKQFTVQVPAEAQMRQVPANVAQMVASRLKGTSTGAAPTGSAQGNNAAGAPQQGGARPEGAQQGGAPGTGGQRAAGGFQRGGAGGANGNDPQQMLSRSPVIHFSDLQKGEAVMLVASSGDSQVTAITLIAGVEALLEAPASQNLLANWSMGGGGGEGEAQ